MMISIITAFLRNMNGGLRSVMNVRFGVVNIFYHKWHCIIMSIEPQDQDLIYTDGSGANHGFCI